MQQTLFSKLIWFEDNEKKKKLHCQIKSHCSFPENFKKIWNTQNVIMQELYALYSCLQKAQITFLQQIKVDFF